MACRSIARSSRSCSHRTAGSCWCTATACSARCTTRKMWFRRRICGPGARSVTSRAGPNFGIGSTGSLRTPRCGSWRRATAARCHPAWAIRSRNPPTTTRSNVGIFRGWNRSRPLSCTRRQNHRIRQTSLQQRQSIRLAFVAALQHLPPRQRAVLLLRDVLAFRASEVAGLLDISPAAANGLLQRARDKLAEAAPSEQTVSDTLEPDQQHALDEYMAAFERADIPGLQRMLLADASLEMPPLSTWFSGRAAIIGFWKSRILTGPGRVPSGRHLGQRPTRCRYVLAARRRFLSC